MVYQPHYFFAILSQTLHYGYTENNNITLTLILFNQLVQGWEEFLRQFLVKKVLLKKP